MFTDTYSPLELTAESTSPHNEPQSLPPNHGLTLNNHAKPSQWLY